MSHASESTQAREAMARRRAAHTDAVDGALLTIATTLGVPYRDLADLPAVVAAVQTAVADRDACAAEARRMLAQRDEARHALGQPGLTPETFAD